jgi:cyanophycin synthetase
VFGGPSTGSIVEEAVSRDIPWIRLGTNSLVQLGYGINQMRFQATIHLQTSSIAVDIACKRTYQKMLDMASIPVASGSICVNEERFGRDHKKIGYLIVLKPLDGNHGKDINVKLGRWVSGFGFCQRIQQTHHCRKNLLLDSTIEYGH